MTNVNDMHVQSSQSPTPFSAIEPSLLPSASSSDLELVVADAAETYQGWLLNSSEWKGPLSLDQYIERERHLLEQELTENGKLTGWLLTSTRLPSHHDGSRPILTSCETIQKTAYIARAGQLEPVRVHGIASVFTRPEYRGRGYAARMMAELAQKLETHQQPNGVRGTFSMLYSDIGKKFYSRFGWKPFPSTHIHLEPIDGPRYQELRARVRQIVRKGIPEVHDLTASELDTIPTTAYLEDELRAVSQADANTPYVAVRPDLAHFRWHHAREEFQAQATMGKLPEIKGAVHPQTDIAIIWCRVFANEAKDHALHIIHVAVPPTIKVAPTADDHLALAALFLRAQKEAFAWNMQAGVEVWDPSGFAITAAQKLRLEEEGDVEVIQRDSKHICSLKWIGEHPGDDPAGSVVWLHNEKYAWC